jgi:hypothetical protein
MPSTLEQMMFFEERDDIEPTCALSNSGKAGVISQASDCRKALSGGVR